MRQDGTNKYDIVFGRHAPEKKERARALRNAMTPAESLLWNKLRRSQLAGLHFRRQQIIDGFIVDFYCHAAGLVIEIDGAVHASQAEYDAERERILRLRSLQILRYSNEQVIREIESVLSSILNTAKTLSK